MSKRHSVFSGIFTGALSSAVAAMLLVAPLTATAQIPLGSILESSAGRYILSETVQGSTLVSRIMGVETAAGDITSSLLQQLRNSAEPSNRAAAHAMQERMNRVHERFRKEYPGTADSRFDSRLGGSSLTLEEASRLRELVREEFTAEFIGMFPRIALKPVVGTYSSNRTLFLSPGKAANANLISLRRWLRQGLQTEATQAFVAYEQLRGLYPKAESLLRPQEVYRILADEEMVSDVATLGMVIQRVLKDQTRADVSVKIERAIRSSLSGEVPASTIPDRILGLHMGGIQNLRRALGDMTLRETQILVHGGRPLSPSADSLIGRYLRETGASTVIRRFPKSPEDGAELGPARLVVAVSPESFKAYLKYFSRENILGHLHTPHQGTLSVTFRGKAGTYAKMNNDLRFPANGTIVPSILLKSTEGQRADQFFRLGSHPEYETSKLAQWPWSIPNYCATSGYNSCTHWFGNIPLGDKFVKEYRFPGVVDNYASNTVPNSPLPRIQPLQAYEHPNPLVKRVWKAPGNEQLADVLGLSDQNLAAEFANPGWVAITLTGPAPIDRVPVVFYFLHDHRAALQADFPLMIRAY